MGFVAPFRWRKADAVVEEWTRDLDYELVLAPTGTGSIENDGNVTVPLTWDEFEVTYNARDSIFYNASYPSTDFYNITHYAGTIWYDGTSIGISGSEQRYFQVGMEAFETGLDIITRFNSTIINSAAHSFPQNKNGKPSLDGPPLGKATWFQKSVLIQL